MRRALEIAERGEGKTSPNPLVGAVVVRGNRLVSEGYHAYFGGAHAEAVALRKAGARAKRATLYVTLEPCSSWGKTAPCVDAVISSGIASVCIGSPDPNPRNHRAGISKLRQTGLNIRVGILKREVQEQNRGFFKAMRTGYPFVTLKMAQSLDGKIATRLGHSRWISSEASRRFVHQLRDSADAVLVGKNTALLDNPRLQGTKGGNRPWRIVLDPDGRVSPKARVFEGVQPTLLAVSEKKLKQILVRNGSKGHVVIPVPERKGRLELKELLKRLASLGIHRLLVEGGGEVAWSLIEQKMVDRVIWIVAPKIVGGRDAKTSVEGEGVAVLEKAFPLQWEKSYRLGRDWVFECLPES